MNAGPQTQKHITKASGNELLPPVGKNIKSGRESERAKEQLIYDDASGTIILNMIIVTLFWSVCSTCVCVCSHTHTHTS